MGCLDAGGGAVDRGEPFDERFGPFCIPAVRSSEHAGHVCDFRRDLLGVASVLNENVERASSRGT